LYICRNKFNLKTNIDINTNDELKDETANGTKQELAPVRVLNLYAGIGGSKTWGKNKNFDLTKYKIKHRKDQILNNCVNPDLGLYVFEQFLGQNRKVVTNQNSLFGDQW